MSGIRISQGDALIVTDIQRDFLPGGALGVPHADAVVPKLNRIIREFEARKLPIFFTRDWHPPDHISFQSRGGPWPPHCIQGTPGAEFAPSLYLPEKYKTVSKAFEKDQEAYSSFKGTELLKMLSRARVKRLTIGGLTTEYCILESVRDAIGFGFRVRVIADAIRGVNVKLGDDKRAIQEMRTLGAQFLSLRKIISEEKTMTNIDPYVHRKIVVLHQDEKVEVAAKAMAAHGIGSIFVTDHAGHLIGVVTDRDLACRVLGEGKDQETSLAEIMTKNPVRIEENATLESVIQLMEMYGIRRVPVVHKTADREKCVGMVSLDDLIASKDIDEYHLMRVVRAQVVRRIGSEEMRPLKEPAKFWWSLRHAIASATSLSEEEATRLLLLVVTALAGRLHHTAAMYFAASLPEELARQIREEVPPGPDPSISAHSLVSDVMTELGYPQSVAHSYVFRVCRALEEWVGYDRFDHVKAQLPDDLKALFGTEGLGRVA